MSFWLGALAGGLFVLAMNGFMPRDDTDPPNGRSGMRLLIDHRTGLHYLAAPGGGITPRFDVQGNHIKEINQP